MERFEVSHYKATDGTRTISESHRVLIIMIMKAMRSAVVILQITGQPLRFWRMTSFPTVRDMSQAAVIMAGIIVFNIQRRN